MDRRKFIKTSALSGALVGMTGPYMITKAAGSPNERVRVAVMGGRARGARLARECAGVDNIEVASIYDVDERPLDETAKDVGEIQGRTPAVDIDFRKALDDPSIDALVIGAPDHWHTSASIMALQAGKHVYVEKPASHNPREAELIVQAQQRYNKQVQMGNQGRSSPGIQQAVQEIREGIIGKPYYAKAFYANTRESIGHGKITDVPSWLDYGLWQGPAPRTPYRDNIIHYNWHWFWKWGTGELLNNGTHRLEYCRWALGVDLPVRISSNGGIYHYDDDWEFADTQNVMIDYGDGKSINWECRSRNGMPFKGGRTSGAFIYGTEGMVAIDGSENTVYDNDGEEVKKIKYDPDNGEGTVHYHFRNFANAIREGEKLNSPIEEGQKTVLAGHLGNISQYVGRSLNINPGTGRIIGDAEAMSKWRRNYEPGWEPRI